MFRFVCKILYAEAFVSLATPLPACRYEYSTRYVHSMLMLQYHRKTPSRILCAHAILLNPTENGSEVYIRYYPPTWSMSSPSPEFLHSAQMKPPPKVDGLLYFVNDLPVRFSREERKVMSKSEAGRVLAQSIIRCEGLSKQMKDARKKLLEITRDETTHTKKEITHLKRNAIMEKVKYIECLAYITCPERWKQYSICWHETVGRLSPTELLTLREQGALELACQAERKSLESDVGNLVSSAVLAGDLSRIEVDLFPSGSE